MQFSRFCTIFIKDDSNAKTHKNHVKGEKMETKTSVLEVSGRVDLTVEEPNRRDPMKFRNGDISLDDAIKHNGGHLEMATMGALLDATW